jgi:hypothetical protein
MRQVSRSARWLTTLYIPTHAMTRGIKAPRRRDHRWHAWCVTNDRMLIDSDPSRLLDGPEALLRAVELSTLVV